MSDAAFILARPLAIVAAVLCLSLHPLNAEAALKQRQSGVTMEEASNPNPEAGDILLPMPCGAQMIFKAVGTQAEGHLWDLQTLFGCDTCDRQEHDYYERRYSAAVSGPFSSGDVPKAWRNTLPKPDAGDYFFYFIGKYEISNFQWEAVMEGKCPSAGSPLSAEAARPKTDISWFDAMNFARTYTAWLLDNAPDALPRFAGDGKNIGYLRLPTEAEWEYAARGGHAVPRAALREQDFFPMKDGEAHADYAVFRGAGGSAEELQRIGSRKANPLGVFDTAGNAAEMVLDNFHFSLGGRLHGSAGGFIRKGGSFLSSLSEVVPGRREEVAFFLNSGENTARDMGARLVISGINTPGGNRPDQLAAEWRKAGEGTGLLLDQGKNPLQELDRLIAATTAPQEKENLQRLRGVLKDNNIALERQNAAAAEGLIRSSLFMVETVRNYGVRHKSFVNMIANSEKERAAAKKMSPAIQKEVEETIKELEKSRAGMEHSLDAAVDFYRSKVEESLAYPEGMFTDKLTLVGAELKGDDLLTRNMRKAHEVYAAHIALLRQGKRAQLTRDAVVRDILPDNLREGLGKKPLGR